MNPKKLERINNLLSTIQTAFSEVINTLEEGSETQAEARKLDEAIDELCDAINEKEDE